MTAAQFDTFWRTTYPETGPISHLFKHVYPDRWFRIHSLPELQRYATSEAEQVIVLNRQNYLLNNLLGNNAEILLVTGEYAYDGVVFPTEDTSVLSDLLFTATERIDLHRLNPGEHKPGEYYQPRFSEQIWKMKGFNPLLKEIADGRTSAFFISQRTACLLAPYDGGVDVVLKDEATRDFYRKAYQAWLSPLRSGL
ncbi:hypothetical protein QMK33_21020 [Hymenobacter sp. H14-R3]|uniref:DUF3885 domain-containing protein n=1 Tax=Hymenobacter sp. H14-R3 TaxID=3046308 RepID=UPI0024B9D084|nr:hypothetical protein [Hymenobacter sp. H14-R3]MDJ0367636.1 hypothetical protein [Hymenobacter sp. H14-R3]